jgi:hypothetical protein
LLTNRQTAKPSNRQTVKPPNRQTVKPPNELWPNRLYCRAMRPTRPEDLFRAEKERAQQDRNSQHARLLAEAKAAFDKLMAEGQAARKSGRPRKHPLPPLKTTSSRTPVKPPAPVPVAVAKPIAPPAPAPSAPKPAAKVAAKPAAKVAAKAAPKAAKPAAKAAKPAAKPAKAAGKAKKR